MDSSEVRILEFLASLGQDRIFTSQAPLGSTSNERILRDTGIKPAEYNQAVQHLLDRGHIALHDPKADLLSFKTWIRLTAQGRDALEERRRAMEEPPPGMTRDEKRMIDHLLVNKRNTIVSFDDFPSGISLDVMYAVVEKWEARGYAKIHRSSRSGKSEIDRVEIIKSLQFYKDQLAAGGDLGAAPSQVNINVHGDLKAKGHINIGTGKAIGDVSNKISNNEDLLTAIRELTAELRRNGAASSNAAADELERACASASRVEVATAVEQAVKYKPDLMGYLRDLMTGTTTSLAGSALFEGIKFTIGA